MSARRLADGAPDILQVALEAGYGSHEAFTRAFREQFGLTPDETRAQRSLATLKLVEPIRMPDQTSMPAAPDRFVKTDTLLFVGLRKYFRFEDRAGILAIWLAFGPMIGTIPNEVKVAAYGLVLAPADESDDAGFDYFAAMQVNGLMICRRIYPARGSQGANGRCPSMRATSQASVRPALPLANGSHNRAGHRNPDPCR